MKILVTGAAGFIGNEVTLRLLALQPGDVVDTYADVDDLVEEFGYKPETGIEEGIKKFVEWYRSYHGT